MTGTPIRPIHFGPPTRRLFGILHGTSGSVSARCGVVLCNPFGQEAIRAQRMMRVLGERLARNGHPVLRFDYFGTGDSFGDDSEGELDGWAADVLRADAELRSLCDAPQTIWMGMRLGATIALRAAAADAPAGLARLVLWDAVLDGRRYLDFLRQRHVETLDAAFVVPPRPTYTEQARDPNRFHDEAIGFALSGALRAQLLALEPGNVRWPARPRSIVAIADSGDADGADLAVAREDEPSRLKLVEVQHGTPWTADSAGNTSLVPTQALLQLVQAAELPA